MQSPDERLPPCLRWPDNPDDLAVAARLLPGQLFSQLKRCISNWGPPADVIWAAWDLRPKDLLLSGQIEVDDETMTSWIHAYEATWTYYIDKNPPAALRTIQRQSISRQQYIDGCADLLLGHAWNASRFTVPISAVDGHQNGRVLFLCLDRCEGAAALHPHPQFAWQKKQFDSSFLGGLVAAWQLADDDTGKPCQVFWHITESDGSPVKGAKQAGASASAAALRAFWHVRRNQFIDENVYVLASCVADAGHIRDVADLGGKLAAIRQHRESLQLESPAAIVIASTATNRTGQDATAILQAATWAEIVPVGTVDELIAARSVTVQAAIDYLTCLAERMDETPWVQDGRTIRLSEVQIPPHVWKSRPLSRSRTDAAANDGSGSAPDWRRLGNTDGNEDWRTESGPERERRQERVSWKEEFYRHTSSPPFIVMGGPGLGKTSLLKGTVRDVALHALAAINSWRTTPELAPWPVLADLATWASRSGPPLETLHQTALESAPATESWTTHRREALRRLMGDRVVHHTEMTCFFFDALDQVSERHISTLREKFQAIAALFGRTASKPIAEKRHALLFRGDWSLLADHGLRFGGPRLVISTRESGLRTHRQTMPFPSITELHVAALSVDEAKELASKWLGADQAARLDAHLRATPSLGIVADSPLLLTLACLVQAEQPKRELPETPAALYQEMMRLLAKGAWRSGGVRSVTLPDADDLLDSLRPVAWQLFSADAGANRFDRNTLVGAIARAAGLAQGEAGKLLAQLADLGFLESSGRLNGEEHFHFRHATFREFLAASHLAAVINRDGWTIAEVDAFQPEQGWSKVRVLHLLDINAFEPAWEPLFTFTAGIVRQPKPLLEMLADRKKDDIYRYRLGLLCQCYGSLSSDKENEVESVLEKILPILERMGRNARRRHPDRWKGWLATVGHLLSLPKSGVRIAKLINQPDDLKRGMRQDTHSLLEILAKTAQSSRAHAAIEALLAICERESHPRELGDASKRIVELAEKLGLAHAIKRLELAMDAAAEKPDIQIDLAESLLRVRDARVAQKAFDLLSAFAANARVEDWCRNRAIRALVDTLDTPLEAQGAALLAQRIFSSSDNVFSKTYWDGLSDLTRSIAWSAERNRSKITFALVCMLLRAAPDSNSLRFMLGKALIRWDDTGARRLGSELLLAQLRRQNADLHDSSQRDDAAKLIIECGSDAEREEARGVLRNVLKDPIGDGRQRLLAVTALLEVGNGYDNELKQCLREVAGSESLHLCWLIRAAEIAAEHQDAELFELLTPRLRWIMYNAKGTDRDGAAKLFFGTTEWESVERRAFARLSGQAEEDREDWFSVHVMCFGAKSSDLLKLTEELLAVGNWGFHPWVPLMRELARREWRFQISRRRFLILRRGQEAPRAGAEFGY